MIPCMKEHLNDTKHDMVAISTFWDNMVYQSGKVVYQSGKPNISESTCCYHIVFGVV